MTEAGLWTDARYFLQAKHQLENTGVTLYRMGEEGVPTIMEYLRSALPEGGTLGFDGRVINARLGAEFLALAGEKNAKLAVGEILSASSGTTAPSCRTRRCASLRRNTPAVPPRTSSRTCAPR